MGVEPSAGEREGLALRMRKPVSQERVNGLVGETLPQGCWRDDDYLWLTDRCRRLVEFTDGYLEVPPFPTCGHQRILAFLYSALHGFLVSKGGEALFAPLRLRIRRGKFREPDLLALVDAQDSRNADRYWTGADLVMEVVSASDPDRDLAAKRRDYAEAAIPEYWIVDPRTSIITVLKLEAGEYAEHCASGCGERATSLVFPTFAVDVDHVFAAAGPRIKEPKGDQP